MDGGPEPLQRREMLRHRIAHVALEAVAGMGGADLHHQPVAGDLGDDRGRRDRQHQRVARNHRLAVAGHLDAVAAVDIDELRPAGQGGDRLRQRPQRGLQDIVAVDARGRGEGDADFGGRADARRRAFRARSRVSFLESLRPRGMRSGSSTTAAATTGPASGPRPASSQPATGQIPLLKARRSRRKVGRTISSFSGRRAGAAFRLMDATLRGTARPGATANPARSGARPPTVETGDCARFPRYGRPDRAK